MTDRTALTQPDQVRDWRTLERILEHLGVSWLVVSILYGLSLGSLPSPGLAVAASTVIGVVIGSVPAGGTPKHRSQPQVPSERAPALPEPFFDAPGERRPTNRPPEPVDSDPPPMPSWASYGGDGQALAQCKHCGDLVSDAPKTYRCQVCRTVNEPSQQEDVVVRSWLHQEGE